MGDPLGNSLATPGQIHYSPLVKSFRCSCVRIDTRLSVSGDYENKTIVFDVILSLR